MTPKQRKEAAMLKQQAIVNAAKADGNRALTAEEQAQFNDLQREIDDAQAEIDAQERGLAGGAGAPSAPPAALPQGNTAQTATAAAGAPQDGQRAAEAERTRAAEIMALCRDFDIDPTEYVRNGSTMEQVRSAILDSMRQTGSPVGVQVTRDEGDTFRERATDALMMRAGVSVENPADGAQELRSMSLRDLGIECLSRDGRDVRTLYGWTPTRCTASFAASSTTLRRPFRRSLTTRSGKALCSFTTQYLRPSRHGPRRAA